MTKRTPQKGTNPTMGALIIRIEFWGQLYYKYSKGPPQCIGIYLDPCIKTNRRCEERVFWPFVALLLCSLLVQLVCDVAPSGLP